MIFKYKKNTFNMQKCLGCYISKDIVCCADVGAIIFRLKIDNP